MSGTPGKAGGTVRDTPAPDGTDSVAGMRRRQLPLLFSIGFFSVLVNLLMLTGPVFMLLVYDLVLPSHSWETLLFLTLGAAFLYGVFGLLDLVRNRLLSRFASRLAGQLRARLVDALTWLGIRTHSAPLAMRSVRDLETVQSYYGGPPFAFWFDAPLSPVYLLVIFAIHPMLGLYGVAAIVLLLPLALIFHRRAQQPMSQAEKATTRFHALADALARHADLIRALGMRSALRQRFASAHDEARALGMEARDRTGTLSVSTRTLRLAMQSGILAAGAWLVIINETTPGGMIAASIILGRALYPVDQYIAYLQQRGKFREARQRLDELLRATPAEPPRMLPVSEVQGVVEARDLHIIVPGGKRPVLQGLRFIARPGRILLVRGPNGIGKSSLLRVLAGAWPVAPNAGRLLLDGADLHQWPADALGRLVGYLPQDAGLLEGTIAQNIARFQPDADEQAIRRAAESAGVDDMIRFIGGYDRPVGPDGAYLSAGQRQRIALARALFGDPVLILLDEPDSALDAPARQRLLATLQRLRTEGRTIIMADHGRLSERLADDILLLQFRPTGEGVQAAFGEREALARQMARQGGKYHIIEGSRQSAAGGETAGNTEEQDGS